MLSLLPQKDTLKRPTPSQLRQTQTGEAEAAQASTAQEKLQALEQVMAGFIEDTISSMAGEKSLILVRAGEGVASWLLSAAVACIMGNGSLCNLASHTE